MATTTTEYYNQDQILGFDANTAVVKNLGAKLVAARKIDESSVAGTASIGVIMDTVTTAGGGVGLLVGPALKKVTSGAAFADLDPLAVDAAGKYQTATAGQWAVAIAMEAASGADESKLVLLLAPSQYRIASANIASLTVADGAGTNDGTIGAITGDASVIAAVQELAAKINAILTVLDAQGLTL